jgi:hypothetical protein
MRDGANKSKKEKEPIDLLHGESQRKGPSGGAYGAVRADARLETAPAAPCLPPAGCMCSLLLITQQSAVSAHHCCHNRRVSLEVWAQAGLQQGIRPHAHRLGRLLLGLCS